MATLRTRLLLSILLVNLSDCFVTAGHPKPPSIPECFIPCDEKNCWVYINCTWDASPDPQGATTYSLHWEKTDSKQKHVTNGTKLSGVIHREDFTNHGHLSVWVEAKNQHGSAKSQEAVFNTADIIKPPPPKVNLSSQEPLEIHWIFMCDHLHLSMGHCEVRHRTEADHIWNQHESGFYVSYSLDFLHPTTVYDIQVRCACSTGLKSDWSEILRICAKTAHLDIWRDCGTSLTSFDCALTWKKLPISQGCGLILGYEITLLYSNRTTKVMNVSEPSSQLVCGEVLCYIPCSLKDVLSVSLSAYNAHGATVPSYLATQIPGKAKNVQVIGIKMNKENLTVSWDLPSHLSINNYVVQYKQANCPPGQGFVWVKVNKSQTTIFFKGPFKEHTPYQVSLFTVSQSSEVTHISSVIGYSVEGTAPRVELFKVVSIAATQVTLFWKHIPLSQQKGEIQYYQIGLDRQNVYNVNASLHHDNTTFQLKRLSPGQEYDVWIKAVTKAGPGPNVTILFKTKQHDNDVHLILILPVVVVLFLVIVFIVFVLFSCCRKEKKVFMFFEKVPDPRNSQIVRQMKHQINDPLAWLCIAVYEPHPKISVLEVIEFQPRDFKSSLKTTSDTDRLTRSLMGDGHLQMDCQDDQRENVATEKCDGTEQRHGREEYSKMVDSDEERDKEEEEDRDNCSSSEVEEFASGYEKHFMPTAVEVINI
ncbi:interleukin 12 receptor, beta 2a, like [Mastacembelus armatus]|uniref:Interleukin 12 receptor, beta 2a, like n=1 Tax=Mastacembelus armatus TaxID=205130 RepID=A0A3Q3NMT0_9TELE|nr:interleukin-6 receptor subunit beta-like [Mastacembelus armatus]